jgi:hypothetical protein
MAHPCAFTPQWRISKAQNSGALYHQQPRRATILAGSAGLEWRTAPARLLPRDGARIELGMNKLTVIAPQRRQPRPTSGVLRHSFRVGDYTVTVTLDLAAATPGAAGQTNIQWSPGLPRSPLSKAELSLYRKRRNAALQEVANVIGGKVMVAE